MPRGRPKRAASADAVAADASGVNGSSTPMAAPMTPGAEPCGPDCSCDSFQVLNLPHLGLSLKPGQTYRRCQLESKCRGDSSKIRMLTIALRRMDLFHKVPTKAAPPQPKAASSPESPAPTPRKAAKATAKAKAEAAPSTPERRKATPKAAKFAASSPCPPSPLTPAKRNRPREELPTADRGQKHGAKMPASSSRAEEVEAPIFIPSSPLPLLTPTPGAAPATPPAPAFGLRGMGRPQQAPRHAQRFRELKRSSTSTRVMAFESMALQKSHHGMLMAAGIVDCLMKPSLQEALTENDLELAVATLSLLLELPLTPLDLVGLQRLFKIFRESMPVLRFLLRAIAAAVAVEAEQSVAAEPADDIQDFFDMKARPEPRGVVPAAVSSKLLKRRRGA